MTEYHWILTLMNAAGTGSMIISEHGTIQVRPGTTRRETYERLLSDMKRRNGCPDATPLFFSLEPDRLA